MDGQPEALLDAYLDGTLSGAQRAAFERALAGDAALRAEVELQGRIDGALRRVLSPDGAEAGGAIGSIGVRDRDKAAATKAGGRSRLFWLAAAAAVVALGVTGWMLMQSGVGGGAAPPRPRVAVQPLSPVELYQFEKKRDWEIAWKCDTDEQFAGAVREKLGRPLLLSKDPGYQVAGWIYTTRPILGPTNMALVAEVQGTHVLVAFDHVAEDRVLEAPAESGLHVFRREADGLVFYEITPLDRPGILDHFYDPEQAPAGGPRG